MLKTREIELSGRDTGRTVTLTELPALTADRHARAALTAAGADPRGGVISLAYQHMSAVLALGEPALELLSPFVGEPDPRHWKIELRDWRNVARLQQAAVLLHADFLFGRELLEVPVALRSESIIQAMPDSSVNFCSPHISAVLSSRLATYHELETVLSTEDVFNLVELLNVDGIREWRARQYIKDHPA